MTKTDTVLDVPIVSNLKVKYYVNDQYVGNITQEQCCAIRRRVVEYILSTGDEDIIKTFCFVGHKENPDGSLGEELVFTMEDKYGTLNHIPWEFNYIKRTLHHLLMLKEKFELC